MTHTRINGAERFEAHWNTAADTIRDAAECRRASVALVDLSVNEALEACADALGWCDYDVLELKTGAVVIAVIVAGRVTSRIFIYQASLT